MKRKFSSFNSYLLLGFIFVAGLVFIGSIYYILHMTPKPQLTFSGVSLTSEPVSLELNLDSPDDETVVFEPDLLISGKTTGTIVILSLKNSDQPLVINKDGNFSYTAKLDLGYNRFIITSFDNQGNSKSEGRIVYYSREKLE